MGISFDFNPLFAGPLVWVNDIRWYGNDRRPTSEEVSPLPEITFQRSGMLVKNYGRGGVPCDPNTLLFINAGEAYCLSHPVTLDCACTALLVDPNVLAQIVRQCGGAVPDLPERLFEFQQCPSRPEFLVAHHKLLSLARSADRVDPLAVEELGLSLVARVVQVAYQVRGRRPRERRASTARAHADTVRAVREFLIARLGDRLTLSRIASHVHCAPHHLGRLFKRATGLSIHRYLNRLRLATALEWLPETDNLAALALRLGFASHSHFSTAFRQEYGDSPSRMRRSLRVATIREKRTNLIV
jgi:AraC family transcriptional regulator